MARHIETLTSLGLDVGTTTTHAILSRLRVETPPGGAASPEITEREIIHRGAVTETPLLDPETIDIEAVVALLESELAAAGVDSEQIETGAVIVTGETARRENAEPLAHRIATDAGEVVAATAGSALEAVLAGRGSGAAAIAAETGGTVANIDVGGGTTNVAVFEGDRVRETRCLDVGGRLLRFGADRDGGRVVSGISPPAKRLIEALELADTISVGKPADETTLEVLATEMADRIVDLLSGPPFDRLTRELAIGELPDESVAYDAIVFSGGVGRLLDSPEPPFAHDDFGSHLAAALEGGARKQEWPVQTGTEDIRATVVGAGTASTTLSGRTVSLEPSLLPVQNVPVVAVGDGDLERACKRAAGQALELYDLEDLEAVAFSFAELDELTYARIQAVATALASSLEALPASVPVVIVTRQNCGKALGQTLRRHIDRPLVVLDELALEDGTYLDVGRPMAGNSVPVVAKTLAFGE